MIDQAVLENLKKMVGEHFPIILDAQIKDADTLSARLEEALASGDLEQTRTVAHTIKGSLSNIGATEVVELAKSTETAARDGDAQTVSQNIPKLLAAIGEVRQEVAEILAK